MEEKRKKIRSMQDLAGEIEKNPEIPMEDEDIEEEGLSSLFGKLLAKKLKSGKKKFAEVE